MLSPNTLTPPGQTKSERDLVKSKPHHILHHTSQPKKKKLRTMASPHKTMGNVVFQDAARKMMVEFLL
jgi:hypothetical protein